MKIILLSLREELNYNIDLYSKITFSFDLLYNLLKSKLIILKNYIKQNLKLNIIRRLKLFANFFYFIY